MSEESRMKAEFTYTGNENVDVISGLFAVLDAQMFSLSKAEKLAALIYVKEVIGQRDEPPHA